MSDFLFTRAGTILLERDIPRIAKSLERIADALQRAAPESEPAAPTSGLEVKNHHLLRYDLHCPLCKAPPDQARLEVTRVEFALNAVRLRPDGYTVLATDVAHKDTEDVFCHSCEEIFGLDDVRWGTAPNK